MATEKAFQCVFPLESSYASARQKQSHLRNHFQLDCKLNPKSNEHDNPKPRKKTLQLKMFASARAPLQIYTPIEIKWSEIYIMRRIAIAKTI